METVQSRLLIAACGTVSDRSAIELLPALAGVMSEERANQYLVSHSGYIEIKIAATLIQVRLRPAVVSDVALGSLCFVLSDYDRHRVIGEIYRQGAWVTEIFPSSHLGIFKRLKMLVDTNRNLSPTRILTKNISPDDSNVNSSLSELYRFVASTVNNGPIQNKALIEQANSHLGGRFIWVEISDDSRRLAFSEIGQGVPDCAKKWMASSIGIEINAQPDQLYAKHCLETYQAVAETNIPVLQAVDAYVEWPGYGLQRRRYHRLVAAAVDAHGMRGLIGISAPSDVIDLRIRA